MFLNYFKFMNKDKPLFNPHDKFFKESFSRKEVASSFIKEYLPEKICRKLDFKTLTILKDSYIDKELAEHFSDILYSIQFSGKQTYIYLLFEHKSYIDPWTGFQLLRNMVKIWENYRKQHKNRKKLPVILPVVIYQGKQKWDLNESIGHLFEYEDNIEDYIPEFKSEVYDISRIPEEKIRGEILLRVYLLIQKYAIGGNIFEKLPQIFSLLTAVFDEKTKTEYLETLLRYLSSVSNTEQLDIIKSEVDQFIEHGGEIMTTIAEKWVQEGIEKGKLEGKIEGKIEDAKKMLQLGLNIDQIIEITGLRRDKIEELMENKK